MAGARGTAPVRGRLPRDAPSACVGAAGASTAPATTGRDRLHHVERGAERPAQAVERDEAAASRTISCAAATSTARQRCSVDHAVEPRRRHLAERHRDRPERPQAVRPLGERVGRRRAPSAGRRTRCRAARACRRRGARARRVEPLAVEPRAAAAARHPLLARPEVVHEAEHDVGHRVPVGDGERERVVRQPALGVLGAVERVDHDAASGAAAEVDAAALLADRGEARARRRAAPRAGGRPPPRRPRRSPACGRRPRRASRSRARAARSSGPARRAPAQLARRAARAPSQSGARALTGRILRRCP